ncbi:MAG: hypothetical protein MJ171_03935 [Clostridia bacterium]|nr:hypothetical protein [Clostridia bacterium]
MTELESIKKYGIKDNPLRIRYEEAVRALKELPDSLREEGYSEEEIAKLMHEKRRMLGKEFKEKAPQLFREYIYKATADKYGDPLGPTFDILKERKTFEGIIESASRPIDDLDSRLTLEGFLKWYNEKHMGKE